MNTSTGQAIRIGRSPVTHMQSALGGAVCNANANDPRQRPVLVTGPATCKSCAKRAASATARGFQP